jgi:hypothetical protein
MASASTSIQTAKGAPTATPKTPDEIRAQIAALQADLDAAEAIEAKRALVGSAARATALLAAMRAAYKEIESLFPGTFDVDKWTVAAQSQAWPRDTKFRRAADLSETECENARERGRKAIASL